MRTIECPQCGTENSERNHLCTNCGYPLSWADQPSAVGPEDQPDMSVEPSPGGRQDHEWAAPSRPKASKSAVPDQTPIVPPPAPEAKPEGPGINCPVCGTRNPLERTYCMRCGGLLVETPPLPLPTRRTRLRVPRVAIVAGVGAIALISGLLVARPWDSASSSSTTGAVSGTETTTASTTTVPPEPVLVERGTISVSASSTGTPTASISYEPSNMIDGDLATAWNHCNEGEDQAQPCATTGGVGSILTFSFAEPVNLSRIEIANGYHKTEDGQDRFIQNARIKSGTISTTTGEFAMSLPDGRIIHKIENDYGLVTEVFITVQTVYPGDRWQDLAVSEVEFFALPE